MKEEKKTVYQVKVVGKPGYGTRTSDKAHAENCQEALKKAYPERCIRIVEKKQS